MPVNDEPREPIALLDLDGTLCNYDTAMRRDMAAISAPAEPLVWHDDAPLYMINRKKLIQDQPGWWLNLEPLDLGMMLSDMLANIGFRRMILTKGPSKRNPSAWSEKLLWCRRHVPGVPVTITEDKSMVYGTVLVDDWPPYILGWLAHRPRGVVLMPAQPWNADFQNASVLRVAIDNLSAARTLAEGAAARVRGT